jgi:hypothetical protein
MMITIELLRSGGFMGRPASASGQFDIDEAVLVAKLNEAGREPNPMARDDFYYTMVINGKQFDVDAGKLKGDLKKIFTKLENKLKVGP